jgi:hypothetical protein
VCMCEIRNAYKIFSWEVEGKRPHGLPRRRREDNIKMGLKEIGMGCGLNYSRTG